MSRLPASDCLLVVLNLCKWWELISDLYFTTVFNLGREEIIVPRTGFSSRLLFQDQRLVGPVPRLVGRDQVPVLEDELDILELTLATVVVNKDLCGQLARLRQMLVSGL